jgi:hypothetical protein
MPSKRAKNVTNILGGINDVLKNMGPTIHVAGMALHTPVF